MLSVWFEIVYWKLSYRVSIFNLLFFELQRSGMASNSIAKTQKKRDMARLLVLYVYLPLVLRRFETSSLIWCWIWSKRYQNFSVLLQFPIDFENWHMISGWATDLIFMLGETFLRLVVVGAPEILSFRSREFHHPSLRNRAESESRPPIQLAKILVQKIFASWIVPQSLLFSTLPTISLQVMLTWENAWCSLKTVPSLPPWQFSCGNSFCPKNSPVLEASFGSFCVIRSYSRKFQNKTGTCHRSRCVNTTKKKLAETVVPLSR